MKNTAFLFLIATCLIQWYIPVSMILQQEDTLKNGTVFKFKTRPIDPNDPFRGKFVVLNYEADTYESNDSNEWHLGQTVFVKIKNDERGYAQIAALEKTPPTDGNNYIKTEIQQVWGENPTKINIYYPFERFYMEESRAPKAEKLFREFGRDSSLVAYSLVTINKGKAALEDVVINGISITKLDLSHL